MGKLWSSFRSFRTVVGGPRSFTQLSKLGWVTQQANKLLTENSKRDQAPNHMGLRTLQSFPFSSRVLCLLRLSIGCMTYNIYYFLSTCHAHSGSVWIWMKSRATYPSTLRITVISTSWHAQNECLLMNQNRIFFAQTSTLLTLSTHKQLTEQRRCCMQNHQQ